MSGCEAEGSMADSSNPDLPEYDRRRDPLQWLCNKILNMEEKMQVLNDKMDRLIEQQNLRQSEGYILPLQELPPGVPRDYSRDEMMRPCTPSPTLNEESPAYCLVSGRDDGSSIPNQTNDLNMDSNSSNNASFEDFTNSAAAYNPDVPRGYSCDEMMRPCTPSPTLNEVSPEFCFESGRDDGSTIPNQTNDLNMDSNSSNNATHEDIIKLAATDEAFNPTNLTTNDLNMDSDSCNIVTSVNTINPAAADTVTKVGFISKPANNLNMTSNSCNNSSMQLIKPNECETFSEATLPKFPSSQKDSLHSFDVSDESQTPRKVVIETTDESIGECSASDKTASKGSENHATCNESTNPKLLSSFKGPDVIDPQLCPSKLENSVQKSNPGMRAMDSIMSSQEVNGDAVSSALFVCETADQKTIAKSDSVLRLRRGDLQSKGNSESKEDMPSHEESLQKPTTRNATSMLASSYSTSHTPPDLQNEAPAAISKHTAANSLSQSPQAISKPSPGRQEHTSSSKDRANNASLSRHQSSVKTKAKADEIPKTSRSRERPNFAVKFSRKQPVSSLTASYQPEMFNGYNEIGSLKKLRTMRDDDNRQSVFVTDHRTDTPPMQDNCEASFHSNQMSHEPSFHSNQMSYEASYHSNHMSHEANFHNNQMSHEASFHSNQMLPPSGLKNEHGEMDNRFDTEAHGQVAMQRIHNGPSNQSSLAMASKEFSNDIVIRNGARERAPDTEQGQSFVTDDGLKAIIKNEEKLAKACTKPKSSGVDTVICVDVSESMTGAPLAAAKEAVNKLLDGFEHNAIEYYLEENVALVTFGNETRIVQHLTNDFDGLRDELDDLEAGGSSPLWLGLALSLTELQTRGGSCSVGQLSVKPRIILITDGFVSSKHNLTGPENNTTASEKGFQEVKSLIGSPIQQSVYSIDCLLVTQHYHTEVISMLSNGRVFGVEDIPCLTDFFRVQENASMLLDKISRKKLLPDQLSAEVDVIGLHEMAKRELFACLAAVLPTMADPEQADLPSQGLVTTETQPIHSMGEIAPTKTGPGSQAAISSSQSGGSSGSSSLPNSMDAQPGSIDTEQVESRAQFLATPDAESTEAKQFEEFRVSHIDDNTTTAMHVHKPTVLSQESADGDTSNNELMNRVTGNVPEAMAVGSADPPADKLPTSRDLVTDKKTNRLMEQTLQHPENMQATPNLPADQMQDNTRNADNLAAELGSGIAMGSLLDSQMSSLDVIDEVEGPEFGARVKAHPDWEGYTAKQSLIGSVIGLRQEGMIKVVWNNGTFDMCRWGVGGQYDVVTTDTSHLDRSALRIGEIVVRGPDWSWDEQDGGDGNPGVVVKITKKGIINVIWTYGGQGKYRFGHQGKYDVMLEQPPDSYGSEHVEQPHQEDIADGPAPTQQPRAELSSISSEPDNTSNDSAMDVVRPFWQVIDPQQIWRTFPQEINEIIEPKFQKSPQKNFLVKIQGRSCKIILQDKKLCDLASQKYFDMRRLEMSARELAMTTTTPNTEQQS